MPLYRKKPVVIEAVQYHQGLRPAAPGVFPSDWPVGLWNQEQRMDGGLCLVVPTLEGNHRADDGDFIIRGVKGEFYPCKPDIFEMTYEPVEPAAPAKKETPRG